MTSFMEFMRGEITPSPGSIRHKIILDQYLAWYFSCYRFTGVYPLPGCVWMKSTPPPPKKKYWFNSFQHKKIWLCCIVPNTRRYIYGKKDTVTCLEVKYLVGTPIFLISDFCWLQELFLNWLILIYDFGNSHVHGIVFQKSSGAGISSPEAKCSPPPASVGAPG